MCKVETIYEEQNVCTKIGGSGIITNVGFTQIIFCNGVFRADLQTLDNVSTCYQKGMEG